MWENESPNLSYTVERREKKFQDDGLPSRLQLFTFQPFQTWTFYRPKECGKQAYVVVRKCKGHTFWWGNNVNESSINDVTEFFIIFDTPSIHRHTFSTKA